MKRGFPLGSTALFFFLIGIAFWLKGGGYLFDAFQNFPLAIKSQTEVQDATVISEKVEVFKAGLDLSFSALIARDVSFGLGLLFTVLWFIQRKNLTIASREEALGKRKMHPSPTIHRQRRRR